MTSAKQKHSAAPDPALPAVDRPPSRWVQFNRALTGSTSAAQRPGLQGRWKPSDRVVIAAIA